MTGDASATIAMTDEQVAETAAAIPVEVDIMVGDGEPTERQFNALETKLIERNGAINYHVVAALREMCAALRRTCDDIEAEVDRLAAMTDPSL